MTTEGLPAALDHRRFHRPGPRAMGSVWPRLLFGRTVTRTMERLRGIPPGSWLHRRLRAQTEYSSTDVALRRGELGLDGLTIAFVSDVHAGFYMTLADLEQLGARLAALAPDLVCLGGDLIATRESEIRMLAPLLRLLEPPLGTFAVPGNHECFYLRGDLSRWRSFLQDHGVRTLINEGVRVERDGASLWLAGVDDYGEGTPDQAAALSGRARDEPAVLLSHHPDYALHLPSTEVDLVLSGHTHGGQIALGPWAPITHSRHGHRAGLYALEDAQLYVGRGVGVSFLPLRIGSRPEVALLRLRRSGC